MSIKEIIFLQLYNFHLWLGEGIRSFQVKKLKSKSSDKSEIGLKSETAFSTGGETGTITQIRFI